MNIYTVFLPASLAPAQAMEHVQLVKQGFDWEALLITPIWAVRRNLWLALGLWVAAASAIGLLAALTHMNAGSVLILAMIGALAFGLEADRLRQANLSKAGYLMHGLAFGSSLREAEMVYFAKRKVEALDEPTHGGSHYRPRHGSP